MPGNSEEKSPERREKNKKSEDYLLVRSFLNAILEENGVEKPLSENRKISDALSSRLEEHEWSQIVLDLLHCTSEMKQTFINKRLKLVGLIHTLWLFTLMKSRLREEKREIAKDDGLTLHDLSYILEVSPRKIHLLLRNPLFFEVWKYKKRVAKPIKVKEKNYIIYRHPKGIRGRRKNDWEVVPYVNFHYLPTSGLSGKIIEKQKSFIGNIKRFGDVEIELVREDIASLVDNPHVLETFDTIQNYLVPVTRRLVEVVKKKYPHLKEESKNMLNDLSNNATFLENLTLSSLFRMTKEDWEQLPNEKIKKEILQRFSN